MRRTFMSKANRDEAWAAGGKVGRRTSIRNQLTHPMYIEDYTRETGIVLTEADKGFGNTIYRAHFAALYQIEAR